MEPRQETRIEASEDAELAEMRALVRRVGRKGILQASVLAQLGQKDLPVSTLRALITLLQGPFEMRWRARTARAEAQVRRRCRIARCAPRQTLPTQGPYA